MKLFGILWMFELMVAALVCPNASASGVSTINFVGFAMKADVIVLAKSVTGKGDNLKIVVKEFIHGSGPEEINATIYWQWFETPVIAVEGSKLVFLSKMGDAFNLYGSGANPIWPQSGQGAIDTPAAKDVKALSQLCRQVRGSLQLSTQKRAELVTELVSSPDFFVKGVGLQLCKYLYSQSREKYKYEVQLGTAYGVENMADGRNHVFYPALQLALLAPPSVVLPRLLEAMRRAPGSGQQNAAFYYFGRVSGTRGRFDFQDNTDKPDVKVRAEGLKAVTAWLAKERSRLITADAQQITDALKSDDATTRLVGRVWLQSATGNDFGFKETDTDEERSVALVKVDAYLQNARAEAAKAAQSEPTTP